MAVIKPEVCFPFLFVLFLISQKNFNILIKLLLLLVLSALVFCYLIDKLSVFFCAIISFRLDGVDWFSVVECRPSLSM